MKIHCFPLSPRSHKVLAVAKYLGLRHEVVVVDLAEGVQKLPAFLALNPNARVPVLEDQGFTLWEANAILQYLADLAPGKLAPPLDAEHLLQRAHVAQWLFWDSADWDAAWAILMFEHVVKAFFQKLPPDPARVAIGQEKVRKALAILDAALGGRDTMVGNALSIVDFALAAPMQFAGPCAVALDSYQNVQRWFARITELDAWKETAPSLPPG